MEQYLITVIRKTPSDYSMYPGVEEQMIAAGLVCIEIDFLHATPDFSDLRSGFGETRYIFSDGYQTTSPSKYRERVFTKRQLATV